MITFIKSEWIDRRHRRVSFVHRVTRVGLDYDNSHSIPSGFYLRASCGVVESAVNEIDLEPDQASSGGYEHCETCFPPKEL